LVELLLEVQHAGDAWQVDTGVRQLTEVPDTFQVLGAVAACAAGGAIRSEQAGAFPGAQPVSSAAIEIEYTPCPLLGTVWSPVPELARSVLASLVIPPRSIVPPSRQNLSLTARLPCR
jgi:hypothetical protein